MGVRVFFPSLNLLLIIPSITQGPEVEVRESLAILTKIRSMVGLSFIPIIGVKYLLESFQFFERFQCVWDRLEVPSPLVSLPRMVRRYLSQRTDGYQITETGSVKTSHD